MRPHRFGIEPIFADTAERDSAHAARHGIAPEVIAASHLVDLLAERLTVEDLPEEEYLLEVAKLARNLAAGHKHAKRLRELADEAVTRALPFELLDAVGRAVVAEREEIDD
jgi:hypothetical protein